jgi:HAMP domain-containing protein
MHSIKAKIILVVGASLLLGSAAMAWLFNRSYENTLERASDQALTQARESFQIQKKNAVELMSASIQALQGNRDLVDAFAARIFNYDKTIQGVPATGEQLGLVTKDAIMFARAVLPLDDASGERVGGVFILTDVTEMYGSAVETRNRALVFIVALNLVVGAGLWLLFQLLIVRRLDRLIQVATRVVGGEYQTRIECTSKGEIGRFEKLFDQFREVFVSVVAEVENPREKTQDAG